MGNLKQKFADVAARAKEQSLHLIYTTPIEIAIGAVFVGAMAGGGNTGCNRPMKEKFQSPSPK